MGIRAINELCKQIDYIIDKIFVFFCQSELCIEALTGYKNMTWCGIFPGYGELGIQICRNSYWGSCRNPGYGNYPGCGDYRKIISRRKQIYRQVYNLFSYVIH